MKTLTTNPSLIGIFFLIFALMLTVWFNISFDRVGKSKWIMWYGTDYNDRKFIRLYKDDSTY